MYASTTPTSDRAGGVTEHSSHATPGPVPVDPDPFTPPAPVTPLAGVRHRARVAVAGTVVSCSTARWAGGPTLEATLGDRTGTLVLAFPGRARIPGIGPGRTLAAAGAAVRHRGRLLLWNPYLWFTADGGVAQPHPRAADRPRMTRAAHTGQT